MCKENLTISGINGTHYRLSEVSNQVEQSEIDSIFKYGKLTSHVYHRIRDGVLVIICSAKVACEELQLIVNALKQKMIDQKKKQLFKITLFEFQH